MPTPFLYWFLSLSGPYSLPDPGRSLSLSLLVCSFTFFTLLVTSLSLLSASPLPTLSTLDTPFIFSHYLYQQHFSFIGGKVGVARRSGLSWPILRPPTEVGGGLQLGVVLPRPISEPAGDLKVGPLLVPPSSPLVQILLEELVARGLGARLASLFLSSYALSRYSFGLAVRPRRSPILFSLYHSVSVLGIPAPSVPGPVALWPSAPHSLLFFLPFFSIPSLFFFSLLPLSSLFFALLSSESLSFLSLCLFRRSPLLLPSLTFLVTDMRFTAAGAAVEVHPTATTIVAESPDRGVRASEQRMSSLPTIVAHLRGRIQHRIYRDRRQPPNMMSRVFTRWRRGTPMGDRLGVGVRCDSRRCPSCGWRDPLLSLALSLYLSSLACGCPASLIPSRLGSPSPFPALYPSLSVADPALLLVIGETTVGGLAQGGGGGGGDRGGVGKWAAT